MIATKILSRLAVSAAALCLTFGAARAQDGAEANKKPEIKAVGVEANGVERAVIEIRVDEYLSRKIHPLLNYVFFDDNTDQIPKRYHAMSDAQAETFKPDRLFGMETLEVYYDVLNLIGYRLKKQPDAKITIVGCNADAGAEKGNTGLSQRRADAVQKYLANVWKIDPARMPTKAQNKPDKPSASKESPAESDAENRRVEILGSWDIAQPLMINDTLREATPPIIRFYMKVYNEATPSQWNIYPRQRQSSQDVLLKKNLQGTGKVRSVVDWKINKEKNTIPLDTLPMTYQLEVRYEGVAALNQKSNRGSMPVQQVTVQKKRRERINDIEKDKYSLILFDFGSDKLSENNQKIADIIKADKRITPKSRVIITGYTDAIGNEEANKKLSQRRADAVAVGLGVGKGSVKEIVVTGRGKTPPLLYENEFPEGRIYCRTVTIEVENPVEYDK